MIHSGNPGHSCSWREGIDNFSTCLPDLSTWRSSCGILGLTCPTVCSHPSNLLLLQPSLSWLSGSTICPSCLDPTLELQPTPLFLSQPKSNSSVSPGDSTFGMFLGCYHFLSSLLLLACRLLLSAPAWRTEITSSLSPAALPTRGLFSGHHQKDALKSRRHHVFHHI